MLSKLAVKKVLCTCHQKEKFIHFKSVFNSPERKMKVKSKDGLSGGDLRARTSEIKLASASLQTITSICI